MDFSNRQNRFVRIDDVSPEYLKKITNLTKSDPYYPTYHIAPKHGLLNDPNGLCYFNGEHHIFYQWFPLGPVHGLKHWYHLSTKNFIDYKDHGIAMYPYDGYDKHGCYTGSAVEFNDQIYLFYTANLFDEKMNGVPTQALAIMNKQGSIEKKGTIIDFNSTEYTQEFRDPIIVIRDNEFHMLIGAQDHQQKGQLALYSGQSIDEYIYQGNIDLGLDDFGYMWECPNYFESENKGIFIFSPQGIESDNKYDFKNVFSVVYMVGEPINFEKKCFSNDGVVELDKGFDFYAPQIYKDNKGKSILIAWLGNSKSEYPTDKNYWAHMLTIPRQIDVDDGLLVQRPIDALKKLRKNSTTLKAAQKLDSSSFELELNVVGDFSFSISNELGHKLVFAGNSSEYILDRSKVSELHAQAYGTVRYAKRLYDNQTIKVFVDRSSIEIFADNGKTVFTSRVFIKNMSQLNVENSLGQIFYLKPNSYN